MRKYIILAAVLLWLPSLAGCSSSPEASASNKPVAAPETPVASMPDIAPEAPASSKVDAIPFQEDQLYAVAYLGYDEINDLSFYCENYLDSENLPVHYFSKGDYYLVIPRYPDMAVQLYQNDFETMDMSLRYEDNECRPFIIQCNVSDIFPDATIRLNYQGETVEFSPFISLADGSILVGDRGLNLTK